MPTANRQRFIPTAINLFLRQDYPERELVIIDDGEHSIADLVPEQPNIRYVRLDGPKSVTGRKRNIACGEAKGDIIVHWDDDDWYAPDWVSLQVNMLQQTKADIVGLSKLYFYAPDTGKCWRYAYYGAREWVAGATMAYRKKFWEKRPFKEIQIGEDNEFAWRSGGKVYPHAYRDGFVSIIHNRNTSRKQTSNEYWNICGFETIKNVLKDDLVIYQELFPTTR
ncbi:MAG: hypothetical protein BGO69_01775 [Bacteroidetes bacterium 46-16]|nr:MAG: hypothetical protein BGO69_01775 [Bacteroidetes bacterium 46-16]